MKRSEKLFLAINEIDEQIVDEAKDKQEKAERVRLEKRMPIKEIIAFAACFAVLAVGIFALVKFKLNTGITPAPIDSDSSDYNSDSSDQSFDPNLDIELPLTEQDKELQSTLNEMLAEARELDGMFSKISAHGKEYTFKYNDSFGSTNTYYPVTEDLKTEPNGLFALPQSRAEMEELMLKYFSKRAVETYMNEFSTGSMTENSDGTFTVETDKDSLTQFIEIDGDLFYRAADYSQELDFDPDTARVFSATDKSIVFDFTPSKDWMDSQGALVYENGGWKLNYFYWDGFISEYPTEFTAEDEELQKILEELSPNYIITDWFHSTGEYFDAYHFEFPGLDEPDYVTFYRKLPTGKIPGFNEQYPRSYNELETLMLKYFTQETVDYYMKRACRGTMTEISNENYSYSKGSYSVTTDRQVADIIPRIIEIDGEMYHAVFAKTGSGSPIYDVAKVISRTDDSIEFSYLQSEIGGYFEYSGMIEFERGGWKMNPLYNIHIEPTEFTKEDLELHDILNELSAAQTIFTWFNNGASYDCVESFGYTGFVSDAEYYTLLPKGEKASYCDFEYPQSCEELEELLLKYFTQNTVDKFMSRVSSKGTMIENPDGTYSITAADADADYPKFDRYPIFIEIDGNMYLHNVPRSGPGELMWNTAQIIEKTSESIKFTITHHVMGDYFPVNGLIKYERGGWRLNYDFHCGIATEDINPE